MASGRSNQLVGQAGEHLVAAELSRRGFLAAPFAGNVPIIDLIAMRADSKGTRYVPIQVKTINKGGDWQLSADSFLEIADEPLTDKQLPGPGKPEPLPGLVMVFVVLDAAAELDRFFILPWVDLRACVAEDYRSYLAAHGGMRAGANKKTRHYALKITRLAKLNTEGRWDVLNGQSSAPTAGGMA